MSALADLTAGQMAEGVRGGRISAGDLAEATLDRIRSADGALNCFTDVFADRARSAARRVDETVRQGRDPGPLAGVPFAVKNLYDVKGVVTLAGSIIERDRPPAGGRSRSMIEPARVTTPLTS